MIVEDGTGLSNSDAYVDPAGAFAVAYTAAWLYKAEWTAADSTTKQNAVILATRTLDSQYEWRGTPLKVTTQALGWPRVIRATAQLVIPANAVPWPVAAATLEMALALLQRNRTSDTSSGSQALEKINLGDGALVLDFGENPQVTPISSVVPSSVQQILRNYGDVTGGAMVNVFRA